MAADRVHRVGKHRNERRLVDVTECRVRANRYEVELVAVVAIRAAERDQQHREAERQHGKVAPRDLVAFREHALILLNADDNVCSTSLRPCLRYALISMARSRSSRWTRHH